MTQHLHTVQSFTPLKQALGIIVENKVGCLPVVEKDGRLIGIITETDVVRFAFDKVAAEEAGSGRAEARPA
jgi:CBS domain-containing protein